MIKRVIGFLNRRFSKKSSKGTIPKSVFRKYLPHNPVIIEGGAHIGTDTIQLAKLFPMGQIYAFEPVRDTFNLLVGKTRNYRNVKTYPLALSNVNGITNIYISQQNQGASSSLLNPKAHLTHHPDIKFESHEQVETITLDSFCAKNQIEQVDFMWLDLQGNEYQVLSAATSILSKCKLIYTEVSLVENYEGTVLYEPFKEWIQQYGFIPIMEELPWQDMGNVLFLNKNYADS